MCWAFLCTAFLTANAQTTQHSIGDDGYAYVPIPFTFNYYNKQFTDSWMYDNGIVSFLKPGTPGALSPGQWNAPAQLNQADSSYFIAALWADLSPASNTTYVTNSDGTSLKYTWNNISEYYSGGTRLSSFSTSIKADGSIATSYYSLNLETSNILAGTVGNPQAGEVNQQYSAGYGIRVTTGSIQDWNVAGQDACRVCQPVLVQEPVISTQTSVANTPEPVLNIAATTTTVPAATPSATNPQPKAGEIAVSGSRDKVSVQQVLSIIRAEQSRVAGVETAATQQAVQQAEQLAAKTLVDAQLLAVMQQSSGLDVLQNNQRQREWQSNAGSSTTDSTNLVSQVTGTGLLGLVAEIPLTAQTSSAPRQRPPAAENTAGGGVSIARLAAEPIGYSAYLTQLTDSVFYSTREIYRGQQPVDNIRNLRGLGSEQKHQQMIQSQYR